MIMSGNKMNTKQSTKGIAHTLTYRYNFARLTFHEKFESYLHFCMNDLYILITKNNIICKHLVIKVYR